MLKIKDEVDLKELKKFGFKLYADKFQYPVYEYCDELHRLVISIFVHMRAIEYTIGAFETDSPLDMLYDLIQAGLVEKVVEE